MSRWLNVLIAILLTAGVALILYPTIGEYIHSKKSATTIGDYHDVYVNTEDDKIAEMLAQADSYNYALRGVSSGLDGLTNVEGYNDILNPTGTGVMGYITIDKIGVEIPIYHGVDKGVLQLGAGHLEGSSLPVGGEGTHSVLSGHRGLPTAKLFTDLPELEIGDKFTITVLDRVITYEVDRITVVLPEDVSTLGIEKGKDYCTLVTCTPYGINTHRLLVRGVRVNDNTGKMPVLFVSNEAFRINKAIVATVIAVPSFILLVVITNIIERRRTKNVRKK